MAYRHHHFYLTLYADILVRIFVKEAVEQRNEGHLRSGKERNVPQKIKAHLAEIEEKSQGRDVIRSLR
jgi:hypothetical protein